jgi:hypothetical protein
MATTKKKEGEIMANDLLTSKMPLYLSAGTHKITLGHTSVVNASSTYDYKSMDAQLLDVNASPVALKTDIASVSPYAGENLTIGIQNFKKWWANNPFYVTRFNVRASSTSTLPSQIIICTPDIFSGNVQTQIIDIGANFVATQYQNAIVTIDNLEVFVGRNSEIKIVGNTGASAATLYLDLTIRCFISLEFCLQQSILAGALTASEVATDVVAAFDNEGTKTAVLDNSELKVAMTPQMRAAVLAGLKNKIKPGTFTVNL